MKDDDLALALASFFEVTRKQTKGLATRVVLWLYGSENDYALGLDEGGEPMERKLRKFPKERVDFETYVAFYGAGAIQGHITGAPERRAGGGWTGRLEEKREISFIHQLLAPNFSTLKVRCGLDYPALNARCSIMNAEPHRTAAILLFQEYLRSVYRSVAGADAETLLEQLEYLPGHRPANELFAQWQEIEAKLRSEKRPASYEIKDGKFFVYEKRGKVKRLVNGWLYGIEPEGEAAGADGDGSEIDSDYERRIAEATFQARMRLLVAEGGRLLGEQGAELIAVAAEQTSGALPRFLGSVERIVELAESNRMQDQHRALARGVLDRMEKLHALVSRNARVLSACGINPDEVREKHILAQKLRRKL